MIKPQHLKEWDKVAALTLSWWGPWAVPSRYEIGKKQLQDEFRVRVVEGKYTLKDPQRIYEHPEARAEDLIDAFKDPSIKAIISSIWWEESIRLLPYIDFDVIRNNPKVFMGYSDTTVNHLMMNKAGLVSFYGPSVMSEFGEYVQMFDYTKQAVENVLFNDCENYEIKSSEVWSNDFVPWKEENMNTAKKLIPESHNYETLQGKGIVTGQLLGGCIDVFPMVVGTEIWPSIDEWKDKILLLETSEEKPTPGLVTYYLRNLGAQGIFNVIKGIVVGKPQDEKYFDEYKEVYKKVMQEFKCEDLPILYNVNIGHAYPTGVLPLGTDIRIDFDNKKIHLIETPTKKMENVQMLKK